MLVADEDARGGVEAHGPAVEGGGEGGEEARRDGEERQVLHVRVVVEAVAGDVVRVVVALPPPDADARHAVAGHQLHGAVEAAAPHDDVVARVVAEEARLHPEEAQHDGGRHVRGGAGGGEHEPDGAGEQRAMAATAQSKAAQPWPLRSKSPARANSATRRR